MMANPAWLEIVVPPDDVRQEEVHPLLIRRRIRYLLFRFQTEEEGGAEAEEVPDGFKDHFEEQKFFDGWGNFGKTWDVGDPMEPEERGSADPLEVVPRFVTIHEEWDEVIGQQVKSDEIKTRKRKRMAAVNGDEDHV